MTAVPPTLRFGLQLQRHRLGILTPSELIRRCEESDRAVYVIEGFIPAQSLSIVVGDSGLGRSPLLYQAALCVTSGIAFLGRPVAQGRVLYLDFENGLLEVKSLICRLAGHLGLADIPEDLLMWNFNASSLGWRTKDLAPLVRAVQPRWIIIDSLSAYSPEGEEKSSFATRNYQDLRKIMREYEASVTAVHHLRKPSNKREEAPPPLQEDPHRWFQQARGSGALVNGCDVRIGIDLLRKSSRIPVHDTRGTRSDEVALVVDGFSRIRGRIPTTFLARVSDEDGEPLGYQQLTGPSLLFNAEQEAVFDRLPVSFRFTIAQGTYGKGPQATTDFLKKCLSVGILRKFRKTYRKVTMSEQPE